MRNATIAASVGAALGLAFWASFRFFAGAVTRVVQMVCRWRESRQEKRTV